MLKIKFGNKNFPTPVTQGHGERRPGGLMPPTQGHGERRPGGLVPPDAKISSQAGQDRRKLEQTPRKPAPYTAHNLHPVYLLHYDWTGWPTEGASLPPQTADLARATATAWESDHLRLMGLRVSTDMIQILFSVMPSVTPVFFCQRVKGRLQHALRKAGAPVNFSRKVSFRSLGENTSEVIERYLQGQTGKEDFADPRFRKIMRQFTVVNNDAKLAEPAESNSGRYWYNLHVVLVAGCRVWQDGFYVGTFSEYDLDVVRRVARWS